jgi:magnesium chelatase family protein
MLADRRNVESSEVVAARVAAARERAAARLSGTPWRVNAEVPGPILRRLWPLDRQALAPLERELDLGLLSARALDRIIRVSWTLADLAGEDRPGPDELARALYLRISG